MKRRRLTETQRVEIWERLASGESAPSVARAYGCFPNAIRQMQLLTGGESQAGALRTGRDGGDGQSVAPADDVPASDAGVDRGEGAGNAALRTLDVCR
jgi:hypothetical protein